MNYVNLILEYPELFTNESALIQIITDPIRIAEWQELERADLVRSGKPAEWAEIGVILDDPYVVAIRDLVQFPNGKLNGYIRLFHRSDIEHSKGHAVAILPELNGNLCLLHQFRHSTRSWRYEIPRGFGEGGMSMHRQAYLELLEEIDGVVDVLLDLGTLHFNSGIAGSHVNMYLARLRSVGKPNSLEAIENIKWISRNDLEEMIVTNEITDSFTIAAYTRAKLRGLI